MLDAERLKKPERGSFKRERVKRSLQRQDKEKSAGDAAKKRDGYRCCWPHQDRLEREMCRRSSWKEAMHWKAKGMGGNPDGSRNTRKNLITGCPDVHQGPTSLHAGKKRIVPLTPALMDGPVAYEEKQGRTWVEVGREVHVRVLAR
jgi:hypothetical protein